MKVGPCAIPPAARRRAVEAYTALHEGRWPSEILCEPARTARPSRRLGRAVAIQYKKAVPDGKPSYHHPWSEQAQPTLYLDQDGLPLIAAGRHETTRRGIEDRVRPGMKTSPYLKHPHVAPERLPGSARSLTTLGSLEWIRYKGDDGRVRTLRWGARRAPLVAHDERGDLHVLPARQPTVETGAIETMARRSRSRSRKSRSHSGMARANHMGMSYDNPRHRRGRSRRNPSQYNPSRRGASRSDGMQRSGRLILAASLMAGVGVLEIAAVNLAFARFAPTFTGMWKSISKIGIGLGGGALLGMAIPASSEVYAAIPAGFAVGGTLDGLNELYQQYVAPSVNAALLPAPAAQALLPGGLPMGYAGYSPAACAVGAR